MAARVRMPCPKRGDELIRETEHIREYTAISSVAVQKKNGTWKAIFESVDACGSQTLNSDLKAYSADEFHPASWVLYPEAGSYAPKGYIYLPNRGELVTPDKIGFLDIPAPLPGEKKETWIARYEADPALKSLREWSGYKEWVNNVWMFHKGEAAPGVPR
jgi:hypothetical protein